MTLAVPVGPPTVTINRDDRVVVCQPDGRIDGAEEQGFFARDTRFISGYDFSINGVRPTLLNSSAVEFFSSRFEFTNPDLIDEDGVIPRHTVSLRLDRTVSGGVHEDYDVINYSRRPIRITLEISITSDFADIFDVKARRLVRRGEINTQWSSARRSLRTTYRNRTFRRDLLIQIDKADSRPQFANGRLIFVATIEPKGVWHTCLRWIPLTQSGRYPPTLDCSALTTRPQPSRRRSRAWASMRRTRPWSTHGGVPCVTWRRSGSRTRSSNAACTSLPPASRGSSRCSAATP